MIKNKVQDNYCVKTKDIPGFYIIIIVYIYSMLCEVLIYNNFSEKIVDISLTHPISNALFLLPILFILIFIQKIRRLDDLRQLYMSFFGIFLLSIFFPINIGYGVACVISALVVVLLVYLTLKINGKTYNKPFLHALILSSLIFTYSFLGYYFF